MSNFNEPHRSAPNVQIGSKQDSILTALSDFGFTRYVTPSLLRMLYILGIIVTVLMAIAPVILLAIGVNIDDSMSSSSYRSSYDSTYSSSSSSDITTGSYIYAIFNGLINGFVQICMLRIFLEGFHALVKTAEAWERIKHRVEAGVVNF